MNCYKYRAIQIYELDNKAMKIKILETFFIKDLKFQSYTRYFSEEYITRAKNRSRKILESPYTYPTRQTKNLSVYLSE